MHLTTEIKISGKALTGNADRLVREGLTRAMDEAVMLLQREVKIRTPQGVFGASGLLGSIQKGVTGRGTELVRGVVTSNSPYHLVVEKGRRPGKGMPPPGVLLRWIEIKFGLSEREAKRIEFVVRRSIARKGNLPGARMFEKALDANWTVVQQIFENEGFSIARRLEE